MTTRLQKFLALDPERRRSLLQAWFLLGTTRASIFRKSFSDLVADLTLHREVPEQPALDSESLAAARRIGWAVQAAARYTPWRSACLVQVLAAQKMLQKRGIPGAFFLGAAAKENPEQHPGLEAHAWLRCSNEFITGETGHRRYTVISCFSWP